MIRPSRAVVDGIGGIIIAIAEVPAPAPKVFRALTTDEVERWWRYPGLYRQTGWKADLRVCGQWSVSVVFEDGTTNGASGEFAFRISTAFRDAGHVANELGALFRKSASRFGTRQSESVVPLGESKCFRTWLGGRDSYLTLLLGFGAYAAHLAAIRAAEDAPSSEIRRVAVPLQTVEPGKGFADLERLAAMIGDAHLVTLG